MFRHAVTELLSEADVRILQVLGQRINAMILHAREHQAERAAKALHPTGEVGRNEE